MFDKATGLRKILIPGCVGILLISFVCVDILQIKNSDAAQLGLPSPGAMLALSKIQESAVVRGIVVDKDNPLSLEFIIDPGTEGRKSSEEISHLVRYFLSALAVPDQNLWVNLSPYESHRVIDDTLSATELGEVFLKQDYVLKQLASSLTHPDTPTGRTYWSELTANSLKLKAVQSEALNKIWIEPDRVEIYEKDNMGVIVESSLKISSEVDGDCVDSLMDEIRNEVNYGKNFAQLRQVYNSIIMAAWFKKKFFDSAYAGFIDQNQIKGVDTADPQAKQKVYSLYLEALNKGAYDTIKKSRAGQKRRYFSGGVNGDVRNRMKVSEDFNVISSALKDKKMYFFDLNVEFEEKDGCSSSAMHRLSDETQFDIQEMVKRFVRRQNGGKFEHQRMLLAMSKLRHYLEVFLMDMEELEVSDEKIEKILSDYIASQVYDKNCHTLSLYELHFAFADLIRRKGANTDETRGIFDIKNYTEFLAALRDYGIKLNDTFFRASIRRVQDFDEDQFENWLTSSARSDNPLKVGIIGDPFLSSALVVAGERSYIDPDSVNSQDEVRREFERRARDNDDWTAVMSDRFTLQENSVATEKFREDVMGFMGGLFVGEDVFELGVGVGRMTAELAVRAKHVDGIDFSNNMLVRAGENLSGLDNVDLFLGRLSEVDTGREKYGAVFASLVLMHIKDEKELRQTADLMMKNSDVICIVEQTEPTGTSERVHAWTIQRTVAEYKKLFEPYELVAQKQQTSVKDVNTMMVFAAKGRVEEVRKKLNKVSLSQNYVAAADRPYDEEKDISSGLINANGGIDMDVSRFVSGKEMIMPVRDHGVYSGVSFRINSCSAGTISGRI